MNPSTCPRRPRAPMGRQLWARGYSWPPFVKIDRKSP
jgi:hypothetical protein